MKYIKPTLIIASLFWLIGTVGSVDVGIISLGQAIGQLGIGVLVLCWAGRRREQC